MSNVADSEEPPEITEQTETIPIADLEPSLDLPPPPSPSPPPEDEQSPIFEPIRVNGIIAVILGIFTLLLLMLCGFFGYQYFQTVEASASKMKIFHEWIESLQNKTEKFLKIQKVLDQNKVLLSNVENLEWLRSQKDYLIEALQELKEKQGVKCGLPLNHWVQYKDHCYHQTMEMVSWLNCSDLCVSLNATFLKTEGSRLKNIMKLITVNHTWLGLSYKKEDNEWKWEDGSSPSPGLSLPEPGLDFQGKCVYVNSHTVGTDNCTRSSSCLCEKTVH
ncbi:NKG2-D type II integral membrane protein-like isoform X1 [Zalophus californianus]|uniref:NKG2-D type II integral membrane protein-like isoform X1 n=1 Tax=Zalophus californianus TaxID=9704 RepID=A0A6J2D216_ZALCA|nr:NKG2-D type II integral membrane protein-like isoform X1 [Zalophus californianus]